MDADVLERACISLGGVDAHIGVVTANSEGLDEDEESFMDVLNAVRRCDIALMKIHSDPSYF
jgi:hypothetical protein